MQPSTATSAVDDPSGLRRHDPFDRFYGAEPAADIDATHEPPRMQVQVSPRVAEIVTGRERAQLGLWNPPCCCTCHAPRSGLPPWQLHGRWLHRGSTRRR